LPLEQCVTVPPYSCPLPMDRISDTIHSVPISTTSWEPLPYVSYGVRNTFIHTSLDVSLLSQEREVSSCPAAKIGRMRLPKPLALDLDMNHDVPVAAPQPWPVTPLERWPETQPPTPINHQMCCEHDDVMARLESLGLATALSVLGSLEDTQTPPCWQSMAPPLAGRETMLATSSVLRLADAIPEPELGTAEMPTVGSMNHHSGNCKPCSFLHKQGCENGIHCTFCHLCSRGEKKRREKAKKAQVYHMKQDQKALGPIGMPVGFA
jgi:hypothetical protein